MTTKEFNRHIRLIANRDKRAMEAFYKFYYEKIRSCAISEGIQDENAKDVASKLMVDIFEHAANYDYIESPKGWMYRAIQYAIINYKKQNSKFFYTELIDEVYSAKDEKPDFKIEFNDFLKALPPRQREIAKLHFLFDFKIKKVAEFLDISVSTVNRDISLLKAETKKFEKFFD